MWPLDTFRVANTYKSYPVAARIEMRKASRDCTQITLCFIGSAHLRVGDGRTIWRAFEKTVRRKPLAGARDAAYGFSMDFGLQVIVRSGIRQKRCY
jgi:hypothetical protein